MTDTSGEINLQSKQEIIFHVAKSETYNVSTFCGWRNTFLSVHNIPFESNASIKPEKCLTYIEKKK